MRKLKQNNFSGVSHKYKLQKEIKEYKNETTIFWLQLIPKKSDFGSQH